MKVLNQSAEPVSRLFGQHVRLYSKQTLNRGSLPPAILRTHRPGNESTKTKLMKEKLPIAFGKPRAPTSLAAKSERFKESRRIEKALLRENHGRDIYAYVNMKTGQVVYSLRREMDEPQIMSQLVFHGKKTVPASVRRDMWRPYMSLHFPSPYSGLLAYHHLRELSLQRQLSPPESLITTTTRHATAKQKKQMSVEEEMEWDSEYEGKEFEDGLPRLLSPRERAAKLMDHRQTSVADAAFVVQLLQEGGHLIQPTDAKERLLKQRQERLANFGMRRRKRLRKEWNKEKELEEQGLEAKQRIAEGTKWGLDRQIAKRIAMQHDGVVRQNSLAFTKVSLPGQEHHPDTHEPTTTTTDATTGNDDTNPHQVLIFWSDPRDATHAQSWSNVVLHGELERTASCRYLGGRRSSNTVHVMGKGVSFGAMNRDEDHDGSLQGDYRWMRTQPGRVEPADDYEDSTPDTELQRQDGRERSRANSSSGGQRDGSATMGVDGEISDYVVVDPAPRKGVFGWLRRKVGLAA